MGESQSTAGPPLEDRPLVTFALFAYNQGKYIREAIEGAFAQTYEPLEIILSDDCSTDQTFEIMEEMAKEYRGQHKIILNRNNFNLGTSLHVQSVFEKSTGALFVIAAGDDISLPERVELIFQKWKENGCCIAVLHSGMYEFYGSLSSVRPLFRPARQVEGRKLYPSILSSDFSFPAAPTCAYSREIFELFPPLMGGSIVEDVPLFFRGALIGCFLRIDQPLVMQRRHDSNSGTNFFFKEPSRWNRFIRSRIICLRNIVQDLSLPSLDIEKSDRVKLENYIIKQLHAASKFFLPEFNSPSRISLFIFLVVAIFSTFVANSMKYRLGFCYVFFALDRYRVLRLVARLGKYFSRKSSRPAWRD